MIKRPGKLRERFAEILELPEDIVMNIPRVTIVGNSEIDIENHRGLIEYSSQTIRINTSIGIYKITGLNLEIKNILAEEIVITGQIENIDISG
ncbi:MAG: sporulation protein YqfC [Clostridiales bacterium]|nr:sporulation protein YqfC [Clostridiales bacterium]